MRRTRWSYEATAIAPSTCDHRLFSDPVLYLSNFQILGSSCLPLFPSIGVGAPWGDRGLFLLH